MIEFLGALWRHLESERLIFISVGGCHTKVMNRSSENCSPRGYCCTNDFLTQHNRSQNQQPGKRFILETTYIWSLSTVQDTPRKRQHHEGHRRAVPPINLPVLGLRCYRDPQSAPTQEALPGHQVSGSPVRHNSKHDDR
jgi:hypothetical protein